MTEEPKAPESGRWQFSLRMLLVWVAFIAFGCVALRSGWTVYWTILSAFIMLLFLGALVVALIDRGPRQAFAIGFIACVTTDGLLLTSATKFETSRPNRELDPYAGSLPTTQLLKTLFDSIVTNSYIDPYSGREIKKGSAGGIYSKYPRLGEFMLIGHALWMLLFGYVGGQFARFVYHRRVSTHQD